MRITDAAKNGMPQALSGEAFRRIAQVVSPEPSDPQPEPVEAQEQDPETGDQLDMGLDLSAATAKAVEDGFTPIGSLMYRKAHKIWSMEAGPSGYALVRMASEPAEFPEMDGNSHEAPSALSPDKDEKQARRAQFDDDDEVDPEQCPNCGSRPGDKATRGCPGCDPKLLYGGDYPDSAYKTAQYEYEEQPYNPGQYDTQMLQLAQKRGDEALAAGNMAEAKKNFEAAKSMANTMELSGVVRALDEKLQKCGSVRDRYGVQIRVGSMVSYTLGGDYVTGRVAKLSGQYADVRLANQMDEGVPTDMLVVRRASDDMDLDFGVDDSSDDSVPDDMTMHKSLQAGRMILAFATWGAHLADSVVDAAPLSNRMKQAMLETTPAKLPMPRVASREALAKYAGVDKEAAVRRIVEEGIKVRKLAKKNNLPFLLQWHLRKQPNTPTAKFKAIKAFRAGKLPEQRILKVAVDSVAEKYWEQYFGEYGKVWVQDVKRRIKADYVAEKLKRQGVDNKAVDYYANYFGEYGDKLVDAVDRSLKSKPKENGKSTKTGSGGICDQCGDRYFQGKTFCSRCAPEADARNASKSAAPYGAHSPKMALPQPVAKRDIFAEHNLLLDESLGNNRVALAKTENGFRILVRVSNASRGSFVKSKDEALRTFAREVKAHITG
jgi:hypothetical protein